MEANSMTVVQTNRTEFQQKILLLDKAMTFFENLISITCFTAMGIFVVIGILSRFVFHIPFMWLEEASRYLMVAGVYVGISMGVREKAHLGLTAVVDALPPKQQRLMYMALNLMMIAMCLYFSYYSISFMEQVRSMKQTSPAMRFPMWYVYIPLGIGFIFSAVRSAMIFWNDFICKVPVLPYDGDNEVRVD